MSDEIQLDPKLLLGKNLIKDPFFETGEGWYNSVNPDDELIFDDVGLVDGGRSFIINLQTTLSKCKLTIQSIKDVNLNHYYIGKVYVIPNNNEDGYLSPNLGLNGTFFGNGTTNVTASKMNGIGKVYEKILSTVSSKDNIISVYSTVNATTISGEYRILGVLAVDMMEVLGEDLGGYTYGQVKDWFVENLTPENLYNRPITYGEDDDKPQYPQDSILVEIKKLRGIEPDDLSFDTDIIDHINTTMFFLNQLEVGPDKAFRITGYNETWSDFWNEHDPVEAVKDYIDLRVALLFDPPTSGVLHEAKERMIKELEYRLNVECDTWPYYKQDSEGGDADEPEDDVGDINWGD